jgi:hypothetical protein
VAWRGVAWRGVAWRGQDLQPAASDRVLTDLRLAWARDVTNSLKSRAPEGVALLRMFQYLRCV